jgi:hypothetical protein
MAFQPLSRRTLLRGAGACLALPFLEAMRPRGARAQLAPAQRFFGFFYPNGTDPGKWDPPAGALSASSLPECLQDLSGFAAEGIWPAGDAILNDVTVVTGIDHSGVSTEIHVPSMAFSAHKGVANNFTPPEPTLDQYLADHLRGETPFRNLALSATTNNEIAQSTLSFKTGGTPESIVRNPRQLFDTLFGTGTVGMSDDPATVAARARQQSVLDLVRGDAQRLDQRLGAADRQRLDHYLTSVSELETQINAMPSSSCTTPMEPATGGDWHSKSKAFIDLAVLAMACDLTRVVLLQYSDSWGVSYSDYSIGTGMEGLGTWSDHFISHKLDDTDRATDLDGLDRTEAMRIANVRVVNTSRFKVRRYAYLVNALKSVATANGTLLDECLVLYASENGDGDSHARTRMPTLIAGHAGGFTTGRSVAAASKTTGALHASIIQRFGMPIETYGTGGGTPIAEL